MSDKKRLKRHIPNPKICKLRDFNFNINNQKRAGIVPYTFKNDELEFCFGIDSNFENLTDFGGGVKQNETILQGAIREFKEESYECFNYDFSLLPNDTIVVYTKHIFILFLYVDYNKNQLIYSYKNLYLQFKKDFEDECETKDINFLTENELIKMMEIDNPKLYFPVRDILKRCISQLINELKK